MCAALLMACASNSKQSEAKRIDWAEFVTTDAVSSLRTNSINGWRAITDDAVIFTANAQRHFLVVLRDPITDLIHADHVTVSTGNASRLRTGFGTINARINGQWVTRFVEEIYPVGDQQDLKLLLNRLRQETQPKSSKDGVMA